jgi:hypothetical protein
LLERTTRVDFGSGASSSTIPRQFTLTPWPGAPFPPSPGAALGAMIGSSFSESAMRRVQLLLGIEPPDLTGG